MQKLQDSVFSIIKTANLSSAVFNFLQPSEDNPDKSPVGGILKDTRHGWLAVGSKFCVVDLRTGLKVAARIFGSVASNSYTHVTSVVELPTPLTPNSQQLIISLQCEDTGLICVFHINGSQILRCIQTEAVVTELSVCDTIPDGPLTCFDGLVLAGTKNGEILVFDLNRASLLQALKDISQGHEHLLRSELTPTNLVFLPLKALRQIKGQRELAIENDDHLALLLNESSFIESQYIFRNPDDTVRMKAKRDHIRVTVVQYIPQLGSLAVGYNFGAFQIWNMLNLELEFTSQVNVECLPVTHFGFQEPCDDPRAFCYLWVVFSVIDRFEEEEFPLAVMYSLTYQGKRMLSDTKCLYQEFSNASIRFQLELGGADDNGLLGGKCVSCNTYSVNSTLGAEGEDSMLNICQLVWECWGENANLSTQYGMLLFDLDQWYKDQMPATYRLESNAFMSTTWCSELGNGPTTTLDVRLDPNSVSVYCHAMRLEEHFYPNSLQYNVVSMSACGSAVLGTAGIQRQLVSSLDACGPGALLRPQALHAACLAAGLAPAHTTHTTHTTHSDQPDADEQRRFLLSVALEARLSRFLKRCAHDWATGSHSGAGCTLTFLVDWCWTRAIELKESAKELTAPLFVSSALPDRNVVRCLEHCVQQLTQLTGLLDAILTKCCNLVVPDALSEMEEKYKGIGTVSLYFQVVQWFLRVGLLPERHDAYEALPYPAQQLYAIYNKRRLKLNRLQDNNASDDKSVNKSCPLLYIDQLVEHEFGGNRIHQMWMKGGSECNGLYPPPSLHSLLRLYLLPDIAEEHKHSLVLYLLVDYSMVYDDVRYEAVIRRLMQFPTMFGLSTTAIKATQAFWHLDHRDFDFALDQLQCLTGNTLSGWQHHVVLSSLLAQKKTQAALQYLHVRKPTPVQSKEVQWSSKASEYDKLEDWQSCCSLYLARGLVFEALDVVRACMNSARTTDDKVQVLNFFFKGCRSTGNLFKILQITLQQFEEEVFIKYLENCNDSQTSDILIMYYLQQARYLEAERYNSRVRHSGHSGADMSRSAESLADALEASATRDTLVRLMCDALPHIATRVATHAATHTTTHSADDDAHIRVFAPKPMSVYVQAKSPKNTFTYKSSFIQDTIENASETWMNRPKMRRGIKRVLDIEETPFICTPKLIRTRSIFTMERTEAESPPKRAKLEPLGAVTTPQPGATSAPGAPVSAELSRQLAELLHVPEVTPPHTSHTPPHYDRTGAGTPHSILKIRRNGDREAPSPVDSRYLGDSDDEMLETGSNHTHYSDSTNKHLRFTIPTASESGSTPSPTQANLLALRREPLRRTELSTSPTREKETDISNDSFTTSTSRLVSEKSRILESPPKEAPIEETEKTKKPYKDNVRARRSLSISANSSLTETSMESIADIPITLVNPRYSGERRRQTSSERDIGNNSTIEMTDEREREIDEYTREKETARPVPATPKGRRSIRSVGESTPLVNRSPNITPDRQDSPIVTPIRTRRSNRSRSRTPELSPRSSALAPIPEQPKQELDSEPHPDKTTLSVPRQLRSKSRTPERLDKGVIESPKLAPITESPTRSSNSGSSSSSPSRRSLRSRSRTPEVEVPEPQAVETSPRSLRSRSKTPEKIISPKIPQSARKKPLSRLVLEANTFAKTKQVQKTDDKSELACTPVKTYQAPSLMDVSLSPIVNKSVLQSSNDSVLSETGIGNADKTELGLKTLPAFTTIHETFVEKSVLRSYQSSVADTSQTEEEVKGTVEDASTSKKTSPVLITINETETRKSVLRSYDSSIAESSSIVEEIKVEPKPFAAFAKMIDSDYEKSVLRSYQSDDNNEPSSLITNDSDESTEGDTKDLAVIQKEKERIVEIEREISEIEGDISEEDSSDDEEEANHGIVVEAETSSDEESSEEDYNSGSEPDIISINDSSSTDSSLKFDKNSSDTPAFQVDVELVERTGRTAESTFPVGGTVCVKLKQDLHADVYAEEESISHGTKSRSKKAAAKKSQTTGDQPTETQATTGNQTTGDQGTEDNATDPLNNTRVSDTSDNSSDSEPHGIRLHYSEEHIEKDNVTSDEDEIDTRESEPSSKVKCNIRQLGQPRRPPAPSDVDEPDSAPSNSKQIPDSEAGPENVHEYIPTKGTNQDERIKTPANEDNEKVTKGPTETEQNNHSELIIEDPKSNENVEIKSAEIEEKDEPKEMLTVVSENTTVAANVEIEEIVYSETKETVNSAYANNKEIQISDDDENVKVATPADEEKIEKVAATDAENKEITETEPPPEVMITVEKIAETDLEEEMKSASRTKKRTKSTSSNKSVDEQTPKRKRTQSNASKKDEQITPENKDTPKRRARTPTSAEVRKIVTRRVSKETGEKLEDYKALDETLTPKRRSARAKSKNNDDNESVASESSFTSNKSKASEDTGDGKVGRKGRKSVLATKTDLSVIPEVIAEETSKDAMDVVDYSNERRMTRRQQSMVESCVGPKPSSRSSRRTSVASLASGPSVTNVSDEEDCASTREIFDVQPIDRISLLNKTDFDGTPDFEEMQNDMSPGSIASEASKMRRSRLARAASESKTTPKAAKIGRRISVDIVETPERAGDVSGRGRRASFTRACEALHTPKGRRTSTDLRKGEEQGTPESPVVVEEVAPASSPASTSSPAPAPSPARRPRRASTQSNSSATGPAKSDTSKRSKKMPALEEEDKDSEKK